VLLHTVACPFDAGWTWRVIVVSPLMENAG